ncbi:MAG: hypothetical protein MAG458_01727 [Nitrosopumilus sp.]|nr:hypothetical protein [Nitrosopumilus sp.]
MACREICKQFKTRKLGISKYFNAKRCTKCCVYMKYEGVFCPCCNIRLRSKPRSSKARQKRNSLLLQSLQSM